MSNVLPFVVAGIVSGSIFGLAATGLVLTYKTSGILNFGHGALATAAAYVFYGMHIDAGLDWKVSMAVAVLLVGPLMGVLMERIGRVLSHRRTAWKVVGTTGLILVVQGLGTIKYGVDRLPVPQYLPGGDATFRLGGVNVRYSQLTVAVIALVAVAALAVLFRWSRLGVAMRAVVDDPDLVDLDGTNPSMVRRCSWMIGSTFAALSGVLILPFIGLEPIALTFIVVQAFGASAIGMFSSIPLTFLGGLVVGTAESLLTKYEVTYPSLLGVSRGLPFLILIIVMVVTPRHKLAPPSSTEIRPNMEWHGPQRLRIAAGLIVFGALASVPLWAAGELTPYWTTALTVTLTMLSLGLLVRTAGMVSLCTAAFAAVGAVSFSQLHVDVGVPWIPAVLVAGLIAVPVGALVAIPSIRLSGLFLALATLSFGLLAERLFYRRSYAFSAFAEGRRTPRPDWARTDERYYLLVLAFVIVGVLVLAGIHRGRLGRMLLGLSDSPLAMSTLGLSVNVTRVIVFCISAYLAAVAGALQGAMVGFASAENPFYSSFNSIVLVAILALAPFRAPWYAVFAGVTQVIPGYIGGPNAPHVLTVIFGVCAIVVALDGGPKPMPIRLQRFFDRRFGSAKATGHDVGTTGRGKPIRDPAVSCSTSPRVGMAVEEVSVRFGGHVAVERASLVALPGRITGLIGPNGAGKTTLFDACSGLVRPSGGRVLLGGEDVSRVSRAGRARRGIGRTFQRIELCESLSVAANVALGREASQAGGSVIRQTFARRRELRERDVATEEALALCGIRSLAGQQAGALSTGQRRLVELARCLAGPFDLLLLDEPSSGLDPAETEQLGGVLRRVIDERGCGILLVEHDMSLVMEVCSQIYVLDSGGIIFQGTPSQVAAGAEVKAVYLGAAPVLPDGAMETS